MKNKDLILNFLLFALVFLCLVPFIDIPLFNEDYLVLHWNNPQTFTECLRDFWERTTGGPYWRPVVWSSYFATKYFFGMNGLPYHLTNIVVYSGIISLAFALYRQLGVNRNFAFFGLLCFALLPARELNFAWVPGRTDLFAVFFSLVATIAYIHSPKNAFFKVVAATSFLLAILSKEIAYAGVAIPILLYYFVLKDKFSKKYIYISTTFSILIVLISLIYRYFVIGGTPFETSNYSDFSLINLPFHFITYIPLAFFNADLLENVYISITKLNFRVLIPIFIVFAYFVRNFFNLIKHRGPQQKNFLFGIFWYILFILPALPTLMQWYGFLAYIGLFLSILQIIDDNKFERIKIAVLLLITLFLVFYNFERASLWKEVGNRTNSFLANLVQKIPPSADTIYVVAAPDKINRLNSMKIGFQEAVSYHLGRPLEVISPIRSEISQKSSIHYSLDNDNLKAKLNFGRFLIQGKRSSNRNYEEKLFFEDDYISCEISNSSKQASNLDLFIKNKHKPIFLFAISEFIKIN
jgi:hypothetical protein